MERELDIQILTAGAGTRLRSVTHGYLHKSLIPLTESGLTALDIITREIKNSDLGKIVYGLSEAKGKHGKQIYTFLRESGYSLECFVESRDTQIGSAGAINFFLKFESSKKPVLVLCGDMIYKWDTMKEFAEFHQEGTISWFTSSVENPIMQRYFGLVVNQENAVIGDIKLNWAESTSGLNVLMKGGAIIADRQLFSSLFQKYTGLTDKTDVDLFWDFLPFIETVNKNNINQGHPSILNAFDSRGIILDIGTPELLNYTKEYLNANRHNRPK